MRTSANDLIVRDFAGPRNTSNKGKRKQRVAPKGGARSYLYNARLVPGPPDEMRLILRYNEAVQLTSSTGVPATYLFNGNSIFDPNQTGVGAQPEYYLALQSMYFRFRVHASKIIVTVVPTTNATDVIDCCICALPTSTPYSVLVTMDNVKAQRYSRQKYASVGFNPATLVLTVDTDELFGVPYGTVNTDDVFQGSLSSNPTRTWIYQYAMQAVDAASSVGARLNFQIDYDVTLFNRIAVTQ